LCAALLACATLAGCRVGGERSVEAENDRLRAENRDLRGRVSTLELREKELLALHAQPSAHAQNAPDAAGEPSPEQNEVLAATPRVAGIEVGGTPAIVWEGDRAAMVSIAVRTLDGRARFVQAVGTLRVDAYALPASSNGGTGWAGSGSEGSGSESEPLPGAELVASVTLTPLALRDAYRSSLTGTHYGAELTPAEPLPAGATLAVVATYHDALTNADHRAERLVTIPGAPRAASRGSGATSGR
jgi:hypothetical protein